LMSLMHRKFLGRTGLEVSELCLGTMTFGMNTSEEEAFQILDRYRAAGGNFIDTANVYGQGQSEVIIGNWLKDKPREEFVIATKVRFNANSFLGKPLQPNQQGLSRKHILQEVEQSLQRLQTSYIDLYQVHAWDYATPIEETLNTLHQLVISGKVRYIGCSNFKGYQLQKAIDFSRRHNLEEFICLQPQYNLLVRTIEWELVELCLEEGVGIIPWSPLAGGWLSGKYVRDMKPAEDSRFNQPFFHDTYKRFNFPETYELLDQLEAVAKHHQKTIAEVSLKWVMQQPGITAPIIGAKNLKQLEENLGVIGDWKLSEEQLKTLNDYSLKIPIPAVPYPYSMVNGGLNRKHFH